MSHPSSNEPQERVTSDPNGAPGVVVPFFQPFYNLASNQLQGFEALARRNVTNGSPELPGGFFAAAEASGSMRDIDVRIIEEAIAQMARWRGTEGFANLILSVNLSRQAMESAETYTDITTALTRYDLPGDRLLVDITTDTFRSLLPDRSDVLEWLPGLQKREVAFCLDGFTADDLDLLPTAAELPVDIIKLHPAQVLGATGSTQGLSDVARRIQDHGLPVVAAGVETREHLDLVRELGFEWAQGFLLGEPVEAERALSHPTTLIAG